MFENPFYKPRTLLAHPIGVYAHRQTGPNISAASNVEVLSSLHSLIPLAHSTNLVCLILLCKKWKARICGTIIPALYSFLCIAGMDLEKSRKSFIFCFLYEDKV